MHSLPHTPMKWFGCLFVTIFVCSLITWRMRWYCTDILMLTIECRNFCPIPKPFHISAILHQHIISLVYDSFSFTWIGISMLCVLRWLDARQIWNVQILLNLQHSRFVRLFDVMYFWAIAPHEKNKLSVSLYLTEYALSAEIT